MGEVQLQTRHGRAALFHSGMPTQESFKALSSDWLSLYANLTLWLVHALMAKSLLAMDLCYAVFGDCDLLATMQLSCNMNLASSHIHKQRLRRQSAVSCAGDIPWWGLRTVLSLPSQPKSIAQPTQSLKAS